MQKNVEEFDFSTPTPIGQLVPWLRRQRGLEPERQVELLRHAGYDGDVPMLHRREKFSVALALFSNLGIAGAPDCPDGPMLHVEFRNSIDQLISLVERQTNEPITITLEMLHEIRMQQLTDQLNAETRELDSLLMRERESAKQRVAEQTQKQKSKSAKAIEGKRKKMQLKYDEICREIDRLRRKGHPDKFIFAMLAEKGRSERTIRRALKYNLLPNRKV